MIKKRRADTRDSHDDCPGYSVSAELKLGRGSDAVDASQLRRGFHAWPLNRERLSHHHKLGFACETKSRTPKKNNGEKCNWKIEWEARGTGCCWWGGYGGEVTLLRFFVSWIRSITCSWWHSPLIPAWLNQQTPPSPSLRRSNAGSAIFFSSRPLFFMTGDAGNTKKRIEKKEIGFICSLHVAEREISFNLVWLLITLNHLVTSSIHQNETRRRVWGRRASLWLRLLFQHTKRQTKFLSQSESRKFCGAFVICYVNEMFLVLFAPAACYAQHE